MNDNDQREGMSLVVKSATRWLKGFIILFGVYIVLYGHLTPGGGFAGGVIIACGFILLTLAYGQRVGMKTLSKTVAAELDSVGALIFLGVAVAGLAVAGVFFCNFVETTEPMRFNLISSGLILVSNIGIGLKVGMSLLVVFIILAAVHVAVRGGKRKMIRRGSD